MEDLPPDLLDCLPVGVAIHRGERGVVALNREARRLLGATGPPEPLQRWPEAYGLRDPSTGCPIDASSLNAMASIDRGTASIELLRDRLLHLQAHACTDQEGHHWGTLLVLRDLEAERARDRELREALRFLDSIIEHVPDMIFVKDAAELRFERFNRAGEELLGMSRDELLGRSDRDFFPPEQAEFFIRRDRQTLSEKALVDIPEEPIDTRHGRRWLHTKKVPILDETGEPRYLLGISQDITTRKEAERVLRQAHQELEAQVEARTRDLKQAYEDLQREMAERARAEAALREREEQLRQSTKLEAMGRLAGGVAHDFNNMLTAILAYARMVARRLPEGSPERRDVEQIMEAGERSAKLTGQLLAFSRQQVLQPTVIDPGEVLAAMDDLLRRVLGEQVEVRVQRAPEVWKVLADRGQLEQVILNLAVNARDAMPGGGTLTIRLHNMADTTAGDLPRGDYVCLEVTDTGEGMTPEVIEKLFEPFFTTKPRGRGTGLGLPTVFGIVKQSGGEIFVKSTPGKGSSFQVMLPRTTRELGAADPRSGPTPALEPGAVVLLVEDEELVRSATRRILVEKGYEVLEAPGPQQALDLARVHPGPIHLLVTDVVMPGLNGRELAHRLLADRPELRVLYVSGYTANVIVHHGVLEPGVAFLPKPFTPEQLGQKVREVLSGSEP